MDLTRRLRLLGVRAGNLAKLSDLVDPHLAEPALAVQEVAAAYHAPMPLFDAVFDDAPRRG